MDPTVVAAARALTAATPRGGPTLELWASCAAGTEPEVAAELVALGWQPLTVPRRPDAPGGRSSGLVWERGSVYGRCDLAGLYRTLWGARTISRVTLLLGCQEARTLEDIAAAIHALDLTVLPPAPFAVRPARTGEHPFRSPDIGRVAGAAVIDRYRAATGVRLPVDLDHPAVELRVELADDRLRIGIGLVGDSLHRRPYLPFRHRAALKPTVAAALLVLAGWRSGERLLDPFAGGGTIPIEAARAALCRPPHPPRGAQRADPPPAADRLQVLGLHAPDLAALVAAALEELARPAQPLPIVAADRAETAVRGLLRNLGAAGLEGCVEVWRGDVGDLPEEVGPVEVVVTNAPYGIRSGRRRDLPAVYTRALRRLGELAAPEARAVVLAASRGLVAEAAASAGWAVTEVRPVGLGGVEAVACVLARGEHPPRAAG